MTDKIKLDTADLQIDDYWKEHIDAQVATIPAGKSFIAITDTHYHSGTWANLGKSPDLMEYVRRKTGIKKVIHLGDPHHGEDTYDLALAQLSRSMEEKFFDYFGDDGLYAIGNHDSNITSSRTVGDDDPNTFNMDILLTDKDIYSVTFKHIEEAAKKNGNVVYDTRLLERIKNIKDEIPPFALDNVSPEKSAEHNKLFGNVSYTSEEMYENLLYWAKMHYAYYDHESKVCYIVLNTGGLTVTDFATLARELWRFNPCQFDFLADVFDEISEKYSDYDVVVAGHMFYDRDYPDQWYNNPFFQMLSAFKGGNSLSFEANGNNEISGKLFGCESGNTRTFNYDFTDRKFTGSIFCITGHRHIDLEFVSQTKDGKYFQNVAYDSVSDNLCDNSILLFLLNQDNYNEQLNEVEKINGVEKPQKGTVSEQCFTIFTITERNTVVLTKIGANSGWLQKEFKLGS